MAQLLGVPTGRVRVEKFNQNSKVFKQFQSEVLPGYVNMEVLTTTDGIIDTYVTSRGIYIHRLYNNNFRNVCHVMGSRAFGYDKTKDIPIWYLYYIITMLYKEDKDYEGFDFASWLSYHALQHIHFKKENPNFVSHYGNYLLLLYFVNKHQLQKKNLDERFEDLYKLEESLFKEEDLLSHARVVRKRETAK